MSLLAHIQSQPNIKAIQEAIEDLDQSFESFRQFEMDNACVQNHALAQQAAKQLLTHIEIIYGLIQRTDLFEAFALEFNAWLNQGMENKPDFAHFAKIFESSGENRFDFFIGPMRCPNSEKGNIYQWQYFLSLRKNPLQQDNFLETWKHIKGEPCQPSILAKGSDGVINGNCLVFFPENIQASQKIKSQGCAIFFFNKFESMYKKATVPNTIKLTGKKLNINYSEEEFFHARSIWGYLHDYYHHNGPRPLHEHLYVKLNWHCGVLEEIKVDCQAILACRQNPNDIPLSALVADMVFYDRLFRYPSQHDATRNFDAATGFFLYEWLKQDGVLTMLDDGHVQLNESEIENSLMKLVEQIETLERIEDDDEFKRRAKAYLYTFLTEDTKEKFQLTDELNTLHLNTASKSNSLIALARIA